MCANFSLLHYLDVGKDFEKKTGLIGFVTGIIGFIITLVYICYNGYVFNNDIAYAEYNNDDENYVGKVTKLFSNGATDKWDGNSKYIKPYENDKSDFSTWAKFKDLGGKQYNYEKQFYETYQTSTNCKSVPSPIPATSRCEYIFQRRPYVSMENKDLYDRWLTTLILSIFIVLSNIGLLIFGFLLFKSSGDSNEVQTVQIQ